MKKDNSANETKTISPQKEKGNKALIPIIITVIAVFIIFFATGKLIKNRNTDGITDPVSEPQITETEQVQTTVKTVQTTAPVISATQKERIIPDGEGSVFTSGKFYLEGTLFTNESPNGISVYIASDGKNTEIDSLYRQMWLCILKLNGKKYLVDSVSQSFTDFTVGTLSSINETSLPFDIDLPGDISDLEYIKTPITVNGENGTSYIATENSRKYEIITVNSQIKQFTAVDESENNNYRIIIEDITSSIPDDRLSLDKLSKSTSLFSFFSAIN